MTGPCINCGATWHVWCDGGPPRNGPAMTTNTLSDLKYRLDAISKDLYNLSVEMKNLRARLDELTPPEQP